MNWITHYTGIDFLQTKLFYAHRNTKTKRINFVRWERPMLGAFLGWTNHLTMQGYEVFTNNLHAGVLTGNLGLYNRIARVQWSGSGVDPYHTYTIVLWRFFIGSRADFWLVRLMERRAERRYAKMVEAYEQQPQLWDVQ